MVNNFRFKTFWECEINLDIVLRFIVSTGGFVYYFIVSEVILELLDVMLADHILGFSCIKKPQYTCIVSSLCLLSLAHVFRCDMDWFGFISTNIYIRKEEKIGISLISLLLLLDSLVSSSMVLSMAFIACRPVVHSSSYKATSYP